MTGKARIIFLHGASSSGKSTIARALQRRAEVPFWHVSIDHLRESGVLPIQRFRDGDFDWAAQRSAIFDGFHNSLAAYLNAGNDLIVEHILDTPGWIEKLKQVFSGHDVLFVAIHCPPDVLAQREVARGDREIGSAERDQRTIHLGRVYDVEIDSTDDTGASVSTILDVWRTDVRRSEFRSSD